MYFRGPMIASAVDGMVDTLPQHWLFPSGDAATFAARLEEAARASDPALLEAHHEVVNETFSAAGIRPCFHGGLFVGLASPWSNHLPRGGCKIVKAGNSLTAT